MAQTNPALNDYVQGQTAAWAAAAATATTITTNAIAALSLGTASTHATGDFATASQGLLGASAIQPVGSTTQYIRGDGSLVTIPTLGTAAAQNSSAFDASGAASTAQAFSIQRANHTGTQTASTISDFSTAAISAVTWSTLTGKPTFANVATSGAYTDLSGLPTLGTQMSYDSGWTANSTVGDKTAALSSYSNGINSTIITALNLAAANSGTAIGALGDIVVTLVKQVAAIRTALVAAKIPNV